MTLTLMVVGGSGNAETPEPLRLDRRGAIVGRCEDADLRLCDDQRLVSSHHLEILYVDDAYWLVDRSTNGTLVNDVQLEPGTPQRLSSGEVIRVGSYMIVARLGDDDHVAPASEGAWSSTEGVRGDAMVLLRHLVRGVIRMIDARSRTKAQLGLDQTMTSPDGENPLRRVRSADRALEMLLMPPAAGYMPATAAIDEAFQDFQAHEIAVIAATQSTLARRTDRFSPAAIRASSKSSGWLGLLFPFWGEAKLWRAYEREFERQIDGSEKAFNDMFAGEFEREYYEHLAISKKQRRSERYAPTPNNPKG